MRILVTLCTRLSLSLSILSLLMVSLPSWAQVSDLNSLQQQLAKHSVVRGDFTQLRHLAMFQQPLSSEGNFLLSKEYGLLWQQQTPFSVQLTLTQDKLRQRFANQEAQVVTADANPMAFYFSRVFLAVFQGDTSALEQEFTLQFTSDNGQWQLQLTPIKAPLNAVFASIELSGSDYIDRLALVELRGDKTEILFSQQSHEPAQLTPQESEQFGL
ncbi:outer membrane lipoprotein carrier protein LolA [Vibrio hippocampi]|uniref:Outer-membrane lipoprotein carrier protein n=1 Tax=Vibrio hippocampi TaxID=654686 RepID=A0ABN8DNT6_9VIBR|nr:outer membrane lipoprotein carrier protein LolA [Vibrio hippocampi]CAH0529167.1 Outer-membrane lipoprotein carrier protein [Vibrio hippocampi]